MDRKRMEITQREFMIRLGKKIKTERENRNWDYLELIIRSGLSQSVIYNLEAGIADNITLKSLIGISVAFEMEVVALIA